MIWYVEPNTEENLANGLGMWKIMRGDEVMVTIHDYEEADAIVTRINAAGINESE